MVRISVCPDMTPPGRKIVALPDKPVKLPMVWVAATPPTMGLPFWRVKVAVHCIGSPVLLVIDETIGHKPAITCRVGQANDCNTIGRGIGNGIPYTDGFPMETRRDEKKPPCTKKLSLEE
jgi:hypothetical protein